MPEQRISSASLGPGSVRRTALTRRHFLRGAGVALSLPFLDAATPAFARAAPQARRSVPRRMLAICNNLGVLPEHFFPAEAGFDYPTSHYLSFLQEFREDFTVFSGVS